MLEKSLFGKDEKRIKRNNKQTDLEGFGLGFSSFLDQIESKAKMPLLKYEAPKDDYDFNKDELEVALSEGQLEADNSDQDFEGIEG